MKKQILIFGLAVFVIITVLSGCLESDTEKQEKDSDGDGYPDSQDDFPNDSNLHAKEAFAGYALGRGTMQIGYQYQNKPISDGLLYEDDITGDYKYVYCEWSIQPENDTIRDYVKFEVVNPSGYLSYNGSELKDVQKYKKSLNYENYGKWKIYIFYKGYKTSSSDTPNYLPDYINLTYDIYKVR